MPTFVRDYAPLIVAFVIPGVGTLYQIGQRDADAKAAQAKIAEIEKRVSNAAETSAAAAVRVDQLEARARLTDETLRDISRTIARLDGNLIAVCSATRGAQCVR